jgi:hypothetical protein
MQDDDQQPRLVFSFVSGDLPTRAQRWLGIMPASGLRVRQRAVALALVSWLPIWLGTGIVDDGLFGSSGETLHSQFAVHARCLLALPMFIIAEYTLDTVFGRCLRQLQQSHIVKRSDLTRVLNEVAALRDSVLPWICVIVLSGAWSLDVRLHDKLGFQEQATAAGIAGPLRVGTFWYLFVVVPVFCALLLGWLWRMSLWAYALVRISRLPMVLLPTHPDGAFGLGFLERMPAAFAPVLFGASGVLGAGWAHQVLYHQEPLSSFRGPAVVFVTVATLVLIAPLTAFALPLYRAKIDALPDYAALVGEHGRKVRQRWIAKQVPTDVEILSAPELGPLADVLTLFQRVSTARVVPVTRLTFAALIVSLGLPLVGAALCQVPLLQMALQVKHMLT